MFRFSVSELFVVFLLCVVPLCVFLFSYSVFFTRTNDEHDFTSIKGIKNMRRKRSESEHDEKHRTWHLAKTKCQFLCATQHFVSKKRYEVLGAMLLHSCVVIALSTLQQTNAK